MLMRPRLDAIVHRIGGSDPCYVSEHGCSQARDRDFFGALARLKSQVKADLSAGYYMLDRIHYVRSFVTYVDTVLPLNEGPRHQEFIGCSYESIGPKGRKAFVSMCPTNYLSNHSDTLLGSFEALGEVIEARYQDENMNDLIRELPRQPMLTTFDLGDDANHQPAVSAFIKKNGSSFEAFSPGIPLTANGSDPFKALQGLERALSDEPSMGYGHMLRAYPIFGPLDVQLSLKNSSSIKRFLISVAPCQNGTKYYRAYAPQADISTKSTTVEGAVQNIKDGIALKFHEQPAHVVDEALVSKSIMTTAYITADN